MSTMPDDTLMRIAKIKGASIAGNAAAMNRMVLLDRPLAHQIAIDNLEVYTISPWLLDAVPIDIRLQLIELLALRNEEATHCADDAETLKEEVGRV